MGRSGANCSTQAVRCQLMIAPPHTNDGPHPSCEPGQYLPDGEGLPDGGAPGRAVREPRAGPMTSAGAGPAGLLSAAGS